MKILIADDQLATRSLLRGLVTGGGHEVIECSDGTEVIELLTRNELPQLLLIDWMMPGLDGISAIRKVREKQDMAFTYIILLTGRTAPADILEGLRAGANDYLSKPISSEELDARLRAAEQLINLNNLVSLQRAQLIAASRMTMLGEMASGIAHEVNNPLAIISGIVQAMRSRPPKDEAELTAKLDVIATSTSRIARIVKSLSTFAREGFDKEKMQPITVTQFLDRTTDFCKHRFNHQGVELVVSRPSDDVLIDGAENHLSRALLAVLENAFFAACRAPEKWIRVETAVVDNRVEISVTDSGAGISAEHRSRLFQPFFTTKELGVGTGLGLCVAKGVIENHQGTIHFDPQSKATRFVIKIPLRQTARKAA